FNPTIGESTEINIQISSQGMWGVSVLDRDGFPVRTLEKNKSITAGPQVLEWDGRDDADRIVPDEAYSLRIQFNKDGESEDYFPANAGSVDLKTELNYYDRQNGVFSYKLSKP